MNLKENIKEKYSWLTPALFAELYWYYVVGLTLPAGLLHSTSLLTLVCLCTLMLTFLSFCWATEDEINKLVLPKEQAEAQEKKKVRDYLNNLIQLIAHGTWPVTAETDTANQVSPQAKIYVIAKVLKNHLKDILKYTFWGSALYGLGLLINYLTTGLGELSSAINYSLLFLTIIFIISSSIAGLVAFILWGTFSLFNWIVEKD